MLSVFVYVYFYKYNKIIKDDDEQTVHTWYEYITITRNKTIRNT